MGDEGQEIFKRKLIYFYINQIDYACVLSCKSLCLVNFPPFLQSQSGQKAHQLAIVSPFNIADQAYQLGCELANVSSRPYQPVCLPLFR